eukprot:265934-Pleurochrysis_carterae.AAC.1
MRLRLNSVGEISSGGRPAFALCGGGRRIVKARIAILKLYIALVVPKHLPTRDRVDVASKEPSIGVARMWLASVVARELVRFATLTMPPTCSPVVLYLVTRWTSRYRAYP